MVDFRVEKPGKEEDGWMFFVSSNDVSSCYLF